MIISNKLKRKEKKMSWKEEFQSYQKRREAGDQTSTQSSKRADRLGRWADEEAVSGQ